MVAALLLTGCRPGTGPKAAPEPAPPAGSDPGLPDPAAFAAWPKVAEEPVHVGPALWADCAGRPPREARKRDAEVEPHGPHIGAIVVRVSPEAIEAFRAGDTLPIGASVVKEKYEDGRETMGEYAVMVKREAGYDPPGGDWEYAYVTLAPERRVIRGRLTECAGCHASAKQTDHLFRSYGEQIPGADPSPDFLAYLKRAGIALERAPGRSGQWRVAGRPPEQHYEVVVDFKTFPPGMTPSQMETELLQTNLAFQLNAPARLAMSFPGLQGLPGEDRKDMPDADTLPVCKELERLFKSYRGR
jgi:hypothetical protein